MSRLKETGAWIALGELDEARQRNRNLRSALESMRSRINLDLGKGVPRRRVGLLHDLLSEIDYALSGDNDANPLPESEGRDA